MAMREGQESKDGSPTIGVPATGSAVSVQTEGDGRQPAVSIAVMSAGLKAVITACPLSSGGTLTEADLERAARSAGVVAACDATGIKLALEACREGRDPTGIVIARGVAPEEPVDAYLEVVGDLTRPVFPGDVFARLRPAAPGKPGRRVDGQEIPAPWGLGETLEPDLTEAEGVQYDQDSGVFTAGQYGLAAVEGRKIVFRPLMSVSPDALRVLATVYATDYLDKPVTSTRFKQAFRAANLRVQPDDLAVRQAVFQAQAEGPQADMVVGGAMVPKNGEDGRFEPLFSTALEAGLLVDESGRMDFFERGAVRTTQEGDVLGRLIPPTAGQPGQDVYGETLMAVSGRPVTVATKEGVQVSADGLEFRAASTGVVVWAKNTLTVTDLVSIEGDVDFSVGNLHLEKGSVVVKGSVLNGFAVDAPGNVMIGVAVGNARMEVGGDLTIRGGVMMGKGGRIKAGGTVAAKFAMNAVIEAEGDVHVVNEISDCKIIAGGMVVASGGSGIINGGTIMCGGGVEAAEIGSDMGVLTKITLGSQVKLNEELLNERRELRLKKRKIETSLGAGGPLEILQRTPPAKRQAVAEVVKALMEIKQRLEALDIEIGNIQAAARQSMRAMVKARRVIHPGVVVSIGGLTMRVTTPLQYSRIYYDPDADALISAPYA